MHTTPTHTYLHFYLRKERIPIEYIFYILKRNNTNKRQLPIKPHQTYPSHFSMKNHFFFVRHKYKLTGHKIFAFFSFFICTQHNTNQQPSTFLHVPRNNTNRTLLTFLHTQRNNTNRSLLTFLYTQRNNTYPTLLTFLHTQRNNTNR